MPTRRGIPKAFFKKGHFYQLNSEELMIYLVLYTFRNCKTRIAQMTIGEIEEYSGMDRRAVLRQLDGLSQKGFIVIESLRLSDDRDYHKDTLTAKITKLW
jgi:DNA-binding MarR family transcriptional regulator